ncbi:hypothetical protein C8A01DRAFT_40705 [Parachaetomium inaequale]|uniref:Uncharacterized protein n=1 Tax=Parachaetomium inaequale TaxID=2588326 RepID=A0AAN6P6W1_9PEZI|nr:hypothetical protein C8A01DRAFT_40705 [Parachaetomium inaequale]
MFLTMIKKGVSSTVITQKYLPFELVAYYLDVDTSFPNLLLKGVVTPTDSTPTIGTEEVLDFARYFGRYYIHPTSSALLSYSEIYLAYCGVGDDTLFLDSGEDFLNLKLFYPVDLYRW